MQKSKKHELGEDGLSRFPIDISQHVWCYEERSGISIYHNGQRIGVLPWRKVEAYINRLQGARKDKQ